MADYIKFKAFVINKTGRTLQIKYEKENDTTFYIDETELHPDFNKIAKNKQKKQYIIGKNDGKITIMSSIDAAKEATVADGYTTMANTKFKITTFEALYAVNGKEGTGTGSSKQGGTTDIGDFNG
jgi:hypothetical protein